MYKEILESIPGIATYPVLAMIFFFLVFLGIIYWAFWGAKKTYIKHMEELPLDSSNSSIKNGE